MWDVVTAVFFRSLEATEEKFRNRESRPEDLQVIAELKDMVSERETLVKKLVVGDARRAPPLLTSIFLCELVPEEGGTPQNYSCCDAKVDARAVCGAPQGYSLVPVPFLKMIFIYVYIPSRIQTRNQFEGKTLPREPF